MPFVSIHQLEAMAQYLLGTDKPLSEAYAHFGLELDQDQLNKLPVFQCASCKHWLRRHYWYGRCYHCDFQNGRC